MNKQTECIGLAMMLGWGMVSDLKSLQNLSVPDAVHGDTVWIPPKGDIPSKGWVHDLNFDPWEDANDDLLILEYYKSQGKSVLSDYKDCLYHETKGHGTHNVWDYRKGKFANAAIMMNNR